MHYNYRQYLFYGLFKVDEQLLNVNEMEQLQMLVDSGEVFLKFEYYKYSLKRFYLIATFNFTYK